MLLLYQDSGYTISFWAQLLKAREINLVAYLYSDIYCIPYPGRFSIYSNYFFELNLPQASH